jgi:pSer/pThr/pTyr-binding forkhead associated (FHA) protein
MSVKLSLLVLSPGKAEGKTIPVPLSQFLIGRDPQCHLRPVSPLISKRHCALLVRGNRVFLRDFGSTNGTFVNDELVKTERQLKHNDVLKVGPLLFRVLIEEGAVSEPTPSPPAKTTSPATSPTSDDDSVAAMLLSLQEETTSVGGGNLKPEDIPSGTTVMEVPGLPPESSAPGEPKPAAGTDKKDTKKGKTQVGNTSAAAAELIARYTRRPRT